MNVQISKLFLVGIPIGLLGGLVCAGITLFSFICLIANVLGYLGPALSGIGAAVAGAAVQSTEATEKGKEALQGAASGTIAALIGALTCSLCFALMQFLYPAFIGLSAAIGNHDNIAGVIVQLGFTSLRAAMVSIGVGIGSSLGGVLGGAIAGAVVGASKAATRE